jgi:hypothetical protein
VLGTPTVVVDVLLLVGKLPSAVVDGYLLLLVSVSPGRGLLQGGNPARLYQYGPQ